VKFWGCFDLHPSVRHGRDLQVKGSLKGKGFRNEFCKLQFFEDLELRKPANFLKYKGQNLFKYLTGKMSFLIAELNNMPAKSTTIFSIMTFSFR
jgi:hypothetical protein